MFLALMGTLIYIVFFIFLPGLGAISLRERWRKFRKVIFKYSTVPTLRYDNLEQGEMFSFRGQLESFKSDDEVWLKGESLSISINLKNEYIYFLASNNQELKKTKWSDISSIIEGTSFYVFGTLENIHGTPFLVGSDSAPLLIVVNDSKENIFEVLLSKGRDRNEIWNSFSPYAYITGVLILIILSFFSYKTTFNKIFSFYLLLIAGTPFYFILPPGLFFYLKYRRLWDISVRWAVLYDLRNLQGKLTKSIEFSKKSKKYERRSLIIYVLGYICNIIIAGIILFKLFQLMIFN